jgi:energy-coupling factor transporter ATP-binding protein EcfA2
MQNSKSRADDVFTPGAPINKKELFAGRVKQIERVIKSIPSPGRHPVIFGQRGVGKTSLANILSELLPDIWSVKINCDSTDSFASLWNRVLQRASITFKKQAFGFSNDQVKVRVSLKDLVGHEDNVPPSEIAEVLERVQAKAIFIFDEFDRISNSLAKSQMADLIKNLSDNNRNVTIVVVGVGTSISELIGEHPSIQRNLVQIELPSMTDDEIKEIITRGCVKLQLQTDQKVLGEIVGLANGFPHYAHLLGLSIVKACNLQSTSQVNGRVFRNACNLAIEDSIETYRSAFSLATRTSKPSRYPQVLCACGYAQHDEQGVFRATDVVEALKKYFTEDVTIQAVVPALGEFCDNDRGPVLLKVPVGDRSHYRFADPMMRPFLRLKAKALQSKKEIS